MNCPCCERELVDGTCPPCAAYSAWMKVALRSPPPKRTIGYGYTRWAFDAGMTAGREIAGRELGEVGDGG